MKKKIPLNILKSFQPKENEDIYLVRPNGGDDFILHFSEVDPESDFYFRIVNFKDNKFHIEYIPRNSSSNEKGVMRASVIDVNKAFNNWLKLVAEFNSIETVFDDPILKGFQEEYYDFFEIVDKEADIRPLKTKQILLLDEHLANIEANIDNFLTEENKEEINEIRTDILGLRDNLTRKPKKWVILKLSRIWGQIAKQGPHVIKSILSESKTQLIKEGVKLTIELGTDVVKGLT